MFRFMTLSLSVVVLTLPACEGRTSGLPQADEPQLVSSDDAAAQASEGTDPRGAAQANEDIVDTAEPSASFEIGLMAWSGGATWTGYTTDGSPPVTCAVGSLVTGFDCNGSRCDDIKLKCQPQTSHTLTQRSWTQYFSEESPTPWRQCSGGFMTGLSCKDSYCDDLSLECTTSSRSAYSCIWSGWFSEENPAFEAPTGTFIRALECRGSNCDDIRAQYCRDVP